MEPKMPETKLERINDCLYHETSGKSKIKWEKSPVLLDITLAAVKVGLCLSINKPSKTSINKIVSSISTESNVNKKLENKLVDKGDMEHIDRFGWRISASGKFTNSRIGLIRKDGTVDRFGGRYVNAAIALNPIYDTDKDKGTGWLYHTDAEIANIEKRTKAYLTLELLISEKSLEKLCNEILSKCLPELIVRIEVDVFLSEGDRTLSHTNISDYYYIEEETRANRARIIEVYASRPIE
jgi:hypothetical protein